MGTYRKSVTLVAAVLIAAGCVYFRDVDVPKRILVPNIELPAPHTGDIFQASLRLQPQSTDMVRRLESEAGIDRDIWSIEMWHAIRGAQSGPGQTGFSTGPDSQSENRESTRGPAGRRDRGSGADFIFSEKLNNITAQAQRVAWNGHIFYFFSKAVSTPASGLSGNQFETTDSEVPRVHHVVHVVDENGRGITSFRTGEVEPVEGAKNRPSTVPSRSLMFDVLVTGNGPWVLYRDREGVFARPLVFSGPNAPSGGLSSQDLQRTGAGRPAQLADGRGSFSFGEPTLVSRAELPHREFQFIARVDDAGDFHVIWTDWREGDIGRAVNRHNLWYCRFDPKAGEACRRPDRLTSFAGLSPVNLMVSGDEVYVSWVDNRFTRGVWTRRNNAKLFLVRSGDRGASFGAPVSIHPPHDAAERAYSPVTMPAPDEGVLVFWSTQFRNFHEDHDLKYGHLLPGMETLLLGQDMVSLDRLHESLVEKLDTHHRNLAKR